MSNPFKESVKKEVWYPDDLPDLGRFEVLSEEPVEAENVPHDEASYGKWVEVENGSGPVWITAPLQLREIIGEAIEDHGDDYVIEVVEVEDPPQDHKPYEISARVEAVE